MVPRQEVVFANWDAEKEHWWAEMGSARVEGRLLDITRKLTANGWEIISVVPHGTVGGMSGVGLEFTPGSWTTVSVYTFFIRKPREG